MLATLGIPTVAVQVVQSGIVQQVLQLHSPYRSLTVRHPCTCTCTSTSQHRTGVAHTSHNCPTYRLIAFSTLCDGREHCHTSLSVWHQNMPVVTATGVSAAAISASTIAAISSSLQVPTVATHPIPATVQPLPGGVSVAHSVTTGSSVVAMSDTVQLQPGGTTVGGPTQAVPDGTCTSLVRPQPVHAEPRIAQPAHGALHVDPGTKCTEGKRSVVPAAAQQVTAAVPGKAPATRQPDLAVLPVSRH